MDLFSLDIHIKELKKNCNRRKKCSDYRIIYGENDFYVTISPRQLADVVKPFNQELTSEATCQSHVRPSTQCYCPTD